MVKPVLADGVKLATEPAGDEVDGNTAIGQIADGGDLLGCQRRIPRAGQDRGDDLQRRGGCEQVMAERYRFMLFVGAVAGGETNLAERIVEPGLL